MRSAVACVTGIGCVTNAGFGFAQAQQNVRAGERVLRGATTMAPPTAELTERHPATGFPRPSRATLLAEIAAGEAWAGAGSPDVDPERAGLLVSRCFPEHDVGQDLYRTLHAKGPGAVSGLQFVQSLVNTLVGRVALDMKLRGPCFLQYGAPVLGHALDLLRDDRADAIVTGGVDHLSDFARTFCTSCNFFDGTTRYPGDGAAFLVLEAPAFATAREAKVLALLCGAATVTDAAEPLSRTADDVEWCIRRALDDAGVNPQDVTLVSAAAGGLVDARDIEADALRRVLPHRPPVLYSKGIFGETWAAAGILATAVAVGALTEGAALVMSFDLPRQTSAFVVSAP